LQWLVLPGKLSAEDKKFLSHFTAISQPESKLHGIKAIKILEYFTKKFDNIPLGAQIAAIQGFIETLHEKKGNKQFSKRRTTEGNEYFKGLKEKVQQYQDGSTSLF
jgi:hypothetical protein